MLKRGDTVILDNLNVHKVAGVRTAIARLIQSPDLNRIEQAVAKLKALLRTAAARAIPDQPVAIQNAFAALKPNECRNYVAAAEYDAFNLL